MTIFILSWVLLLLVASLAAHNCDASEIGQKLLFFGIAALSMVYGYSIAMSSAAKCGQDGCFPVIEWSCTCAEDTEEEK